MKTIILWYRNDLRVHDLPALAAAAQADQIVPVFIFDKAIYGGKFASSNRNRFLLESLQDLKKSLTERGSNLYIRHGKAAEELPKLAKECKAEAVYYTIDYTPYAIARDQAIKHTLDDVGIEFTGFPGRLAVDSLKDIKTKTGTVVKVFTPFWKQWQQRPRRELSTTPRKLVSPPTITIGSLPTLQSLTQKNQLSPQAQSGGEIAGRQALKHWLDGPIHDYYHQHDDMGAGETSRLSAYLHFGCLSVREIESLLPDGKGVASWHRQLAWRDFYHYILLQYPDNLDQELQVRYRDFAWDTDTRLLKAWQDGQTGYPIVDAAMRQLQQEGWMHNRGRLIVGSFLTKDLHLDWRLGQQYFMQQLIDGDHPNNNGNWQWISSVGVDPAPIFRRLYNPVLQQQHHDPHGNYVRRFVPELAAVPDAYLAEPWTMPADVQQQASCQIGSDYPAPVVDHATERRVTLERYQATQ